VVYLSVPTLAATPCPTPEQGADVLHTDRIPPSIRLLLCGLLALTAATAAAAPPAGYYDTVVFSSPEAMRASVHAVIDGHVKIPYTSSSTDTWNVLNLADEDPYNTTRILDLYQNRGFTKIEGGTGLYNREHSWPNSYGFPDDGTTNKPYTDCHHLFACDVEYNSDRGNKPYGECASGCTSDPADFYDGQGGVNYYSSSGAAGIWETWDGRKGDVARAMFYMDVRYEGDAGSEPDLILTDNVALITASATGSNESVAYMGLLTTLLAWNAQDPVDAKEQHRNDVVYSYQGNRNPFIDHPEWVDDIFADGLATGAGDLVAARPRIVGAHPNPFNPSTTIDLSLPAAATVRLDIFGADGRLVRALWRGDREAGDFMVNWDGRGDAGQDLSSGTYFLRATGAGGADTRKLLLLK
jgi:endonuclease I